VAEASEEGQGPRRAVEPMMMMSVCVCVCVCVVNDAAAIRVVTCRDQTCRQQTEQSNSYACLFLIKAFSPFLIDSGFLAICV
jgi:hypothetical protein